MVRFSFLIILLFLSALFSGSETAFFSLPPWRVRRLAKEGRRWAILAETLLSSPERLLITIILGNEAVNITLSTIAAGIRRDFLPGLGSLGFTLGVAATSLVLLIFGEVTPKVIAMRDPEGWGRRFTRFIKGISVLFSPFSLLLSPLLLLLAKRKEQPPSSEELMILFRLGAEEGVIEAKERVMIDGIFSLSELTVAEVMTPRTQIIAVRENISADALFRFVSQFPYSRYPVYLKDLDDIKGILYAKDLLAYKFGFPPRGRWQRLIRPPFFLPETPSLSEAFQLMRKRRTTIAIVVDEYGGTAGLITMEDIMRKLVGRREEFIYEKRGDEYLLAGRAPLPLLSSEFGRRIEDEYSATLAGYLLNLAGRLLREGDIVEDDHFRYQVIETDGARIVKVKVKRKD
ncbi:MAG: HlyC/CorC family transporter [Acidobacteria bacterium]|nr:HlyC/CorC family transporter [Acidobacteriota bacterium]